jgi:hypothetical protein
MLSIPRDEFCGVTAFCHFFAGSVPATLVLQVSVLKGFFFKDCEESLRSVRKFATMRPGNAARRASKTDVFAGFRCRSKSRPDGELPRPTRLGSPAARLFMN